MAPTAWLVLHGVNIVWTLYDFRTESRRKAQVARSLDEIRISDRQHGGLSTAESVLFLVERGDRIERRTGACSRGDSS